MQSVEHDKSELNELQASLDAYLDEQLEFDQLRTRWITTLAENPKMRSEAVRLIYQQPSDRNLEEERALSLKRVVEAAIHEENDDWTVDLEEDSHTESLAGNVVDETVETTIPDVKAVAPKSRLSDRIGPGRVLKDRFVLEEPLGGGGIGIVFKARDRLRDPTNALSAQIAVKVLRDDYRTKPELLRALQREAVTAQDLSHPNIVRIHDFHQDGDICFLTMELLEGEPLRRVLSRLQPATLPTGLAMRIIAGMCRGLAHAHTNGLVHADFKPGNVFLTIDNVPKIFDFGSATVAAPRDQNSDVSRKPAEKGLRAITPAYSSCNRLEGGAPCFSDDVYSLSCVIYELLAGRHPYDRKSALVARELNLRPNRINGLTDLQWRTLGAGLMPSRQDRSTEIYDLQEAFSGRAPVVPLSRPIERKRGSSGTFALVITAVLLGAGFLLSPTMFEVPLIPSKIVDLPPQPAPAPIIESAVDNTSIESAATEVEPALEIVDMPTPTSESVASEADPDLEIVDLLPPTVATRPDEFLPGSLDSELAHTRSDTPQPEANSALPVLPGFQLNAAEYLVHENAAAIAVQINRQGDLSGPANVQWTTFAGSADPQLDYASFFQRIVHFGAGEQTKTIFIPIVSDNSIEIDEEFQVGLSRPGNNMVLAQPYTATVTIIDDDA